MIADRVARQRLGRSGRSIEENRGSHSSCEHDSRGECEPSTGKRPRAMSVCCRLAQLIAQPVGELPGWLQLRIPIEGGAESDAQSAARFDFRAARWTRIEMPQDLVVRLCQ
jgi:hypothetical protein